LIVRNLQDFGDYSCKASNKLGTVTQNITLKRANQPLTPTLQILHLGSDGVAVKVINPVHPNQYHDPAMDGGEDPSLADLPVTGYSVQFKVLGDRNWLTAQNVSLTGYGKLHSSPGVGRDKNLAVLRNYSPSFIKRSVFCNMKH